VINFFNAQAGGAPNLGGLDPKTGLPKVPLTIVNDTKFTFTMPKAAIPGPAYVQALNPPFVPYSSSGNAPGRALTLWAKSTALTSSVNPSTLGQAVTFTATVTPATLAASGAPTGTVTFKDGAAVIGAGTLIGAKATLLTSKLSTGSHSITAVYGGSASYFGSTSALPQVVH